MVGGGHAFKILLYRSATGNYCFVDVIGKMCTPSMKLKGSALLHLKSSGLTCTRMIDRRIKSRWKKLKLMEKKNLSNSCLNHRFFAETSYALY